MQWLGNEKIEIKLTLKKYETWVRFIKISLTVRYTVSVAILSKIGKYSKRVVFSKQPNVIFGQNL